MSVKGHIKEAADSGMPRDRLTWCCCRSMETRRQLL